MKKFKNKIIKLLGGYTASEYIRASKDGQKLVDVNALLKNMVNELEVSITEAEPVRDEMVITNVEYGYMSSVVQYLNTHGKPLTFEKFVDKHIAGSKEFKSYSETKDLYDAYLKMFETSIEKKEGAYSLHKEAAMRNEIYRAGLTDKEVARYLMKNDIA